MILFALMLCAFAVATTEFVLVGLLSDVAAALHVSLSATGLLVTTYMLVVTVGGPAAATLTRRLPRRGLLIATMGLSAVAAVGSALAPTYPLLMAARVGSALAQALFMAVASQVAMAAVGPDRQTAAVARVFGGFALATVIGLPLGALIGDAYGWRATFWSVAALSVMGLGGVLAFCPPIEAPRADATPWRALRQRQTVYGLVVTLTALTAFVAVFTYVAPTLRQVAGATAVETGIALVVYGAGTVAGNIAAGRVKPQRIAAALPIPLAVLALALLANGVTMSRVWLAAPTLFVLGASTFAIVPLVQTRLMAESGSGAAGFVAAINISVAGLAGALGAALGSAVLSTGLGLTAIGPVAAPIAAIGLGVALLARARDRSAEGARAIRAGAPEDRESYVELRDARTAPKNAARDTHDNAVGPHNSATTQEA